MVKNGGEACGGMDSPGVLEKKLELFDHGNHVRCRIGLGIGIAS